MLWVRRILLGGLILGLVLGSHYFVQSNAQTVSLEFGAKRFDEVALWLVLLCTFATGFGVATVVAALRGARLRLVSRRYRKQARNLEAEVHQLRTLPLAEADEAAPAVSESTTGDGLSRGT
jgi:uncharacterized integral membrane protein